MKRFVSALFACLLCILPLAAHGAQVGTITGISGSASWRVKANIPYAPLAKGAAIAEGNWIKTGPNGWVELTLNDKSKFTLANNTEFEITSFLLTKNKREGTFNLAQGKLRASVVKFGGRQSGMTVKSGTAVAGIKGTEFLMLSQGQANVFFGNEGKVAVSGEAKGQQQPLVAGTMTQNTRGITPVEPLKVEAGSPVAAAKELFDKVTAAQPPAEWTDSGQIADIIARWNINYGHYLADSGKYEEALHVFQIALDLTKVPDVRADAHMERGAVYARFLANPELALAAYLLVLEEYPQLPQAETALFSTAQTLLEMGFNEQARQRFEQYLKHYPQGRHAGTSETLLKNLGK
ncbi:FecR domain-containing protein [Trichlorobacter ammonificans]|uniref:FecR domain-containing protein n=1 Tax=Trichlorobacter ammonificans TaxID=2916410 RepID=A0ABN8HFR5_9BACT|nr:FecR domain-containing protein [Trichlorobacter ammonificans]CAH2031621.1 FecR domain-containing protein [Trichlorobacter ammonificans]